MLCHFLGDYFANRISSREKFIEVLLEVKSIAYSASASGTYLSTVLFEELGILDQIKDKCIRVSGERVGAVVARGEAEIGFQQVSELLPISGIKYIGPIPHELQKITVFSAGILVQSANKEQARMLIDFLASHENHQVISKTGMEPIGKLGGG